MDLSVETIGAADPLLPRRRLNVDEYHRMAQAGILRREDHVELIEGVIIEKHAPGGPRPRDLTVAEYHRMGEAGILDEDDRVELIEGVLVEMTPVGGPHIAAVFVLNRLFQQAVGNAAVVSVQSPVRLGERSEPEPDLALVRQRPDRYRNGPPRAEDVLLAVEVADTSLLRDRRVKCTLYAMHRVPETWIVDLAGGAIEVYRGPTDGGYASVSVHRDGETVASLAVPEARIAVADVFG